MAESMSREEGIRKLGGLIKGVKVAMLTTVTARGWLRSRPMVAQSGFDGQFWFVAAREQAKAADVRDRRQVNVSLAAPDRGVYVSVSGIATIVEDRSRLAAMWNESYEPWFPKGLNDPDLILIRVDVQQADCWERNRFVQIPALSEPKAGFRDVEPDAGI